MPIVSTDIVEVLSGGNANTSTAASLGGNPSTVGGGIIVDNTTHNLWDVVSSAESSAGDTEYRCIFVKNEHDTLTLQNAKVWITTQTPSSDTSVEIGLGSSAIGSNPNEQGGPLATEATVPTGVTFGTAAGEGNALSIGSIPPNQYKAIWLKRIINLGASAANDDSYVLSYAGDTSA